MRDKDEPSPLVHVCLLGIFGLEKRDEQGAWTSAEQEMGNKTYARPMFKRLLCAPGRCLPRERLIRDVLPPEKDPHLTDRYLRDAVYKIRHAIGKEALRGNAVSYYLADQTTLWSDLEAAENLLHEAERLPGARALALLEQAHALYGRGEPLEGETGQWRYAILARVEQEKKSCYLALGHAYEQLHMLWHAEKTYRELAELYPLDEAVLGSLLTFLQRAGMLSEAKMYYEQARHFFDEEGLELSEEIHALARKQTRPELTSVIVLPHIAHVHKNADVLPWMLAETQGILEEKTSNELKGQDMDEQRRHLLQQLFVMSTASFSPFLSTGMLSEYAKGISACWDLYFEGKTQYVMSLLPVYRFHLALLAQLSSPIQKQACALASQVYQLLCEHAIDQENFDFAQETNQLALLYAQYAENTNLQVATLIRRANLFFHTLQLEKALQAYQQTLPLVDGITPLLRGRVYAGFAEVCAMLQQRQEAFTYIGLAHEHYPLQPELDTAFNYTRITRYSLYVFGEGQARLSLNQPEEAYKNFSYVEKNLPDPLADPITRVDLAYYQARALALGGDLEASCAQVLIAATLAKKAGSKLYYNKIINTYQGIKAKWKHERPVIELEGYFHSHFCAD
ncbi:AfsR/SARP family transcriptional regulator [Ktedonosporobacter rubrisoli]|nr:bacterial transcriptional activator domain-containing protein [Ktedonosporobacter rubrisoli]